MGAGPLAILGAGALVDSLGAIVEKVTITNQSALCGDEIGQILEICARVARSARAALEAGRAALLLTGNCNHAHLAAATALAPRARPDRIGVVWLDAHADFDTPENTRSSFFDGMGLSVLTGDAYPALAAQRLPGFQPLQQDHVILFGVRDLEPYQASRLAASPVRAFGPAHLPELDHALADLAAVVDVAYLHIDLDCLDPSHGQANEYAAAGGLPLEVVMRLIDQVTTKFDVRIAAVTAYNPDTDSDDTMRNTARQLVAHLLRALATSHSEHPARIA
jgi:arginase